MRYFLSSNNLKLFDWFIFIDDDIYLRSFSLLQMLTSLKFNAHFHNKPVAIVPSQVSRGFSFSKYKLNNGLFRNVSCLVHDFSFAQPAIINKFLFNFIFLYINFYALLLHTIIVLRTIITHYT
jgi:hypothetical protein